MRRRGSWVVGLLLATVLSAAVDEVACAAFGGGRLVGDRVTADTLGDTDRSVDGSADWMAPEGTLAALVAPLSARTFSPTPRVDRLRAGVPPQPDHPPRPAR